MKYRVDIVEVSDWNSSYDRLINRRYVEADTENAARRIVREEYPNEFKYHMEVMAVKQENLVSNDEH